MKRIFDQAFDIVVMQWNDRERLDFVAYVGGYNPELVLDFELQRRARQTPLQAADDKLKTAAFWVAETGADAVLGMARDHDGPGYDEYDPNADYGVTR